MDQSCIDEQLTKLLHQSQRELVFELRRLSHKERVVTRRHQQFETLLENVLAGHIRQRFDVLDDLDVTKSEAQTTADVNNGDESIEGENPDVALEARQNSRPLEITDEIQVLAHQQPVTHLLTSGFRSMLEQAVTENNSRLLRASAHHRPSTLHVSPRSNQSTEGTRYSLPARPSPHAGQPQRPHVNGNGTEEEIIGHQQVDLIQHMDQVQQEEVLMEVEEVVHHHVVSAIMASEFRNVLERHLEDRIARAGADGPQVERYVRELAHQRRTQPRVQPQAPGTRGADSTEVLTLKNDIRTLTQMVQELDRRVKLSFELHMDNQRLLRQEISAIAHAVVGSQSAVSNAPVQSGPAAGVGQCVICQASPSDSTFYSCGHMCACNLCARDLISRHDPVCPICRAPVKDILRVYQV